MSGTSSRLMGFAACFMRLLARSAYSKVDVMADIGDCMRARLRQYKHHAEELTITPWALEEPKELAPVDWEMRKKLFGDSLP